MKIDNKSRGWRLTVGNKLSFVNNNFLYNINKSVLTCVAFMYINVEGCSKTSWSKRNNRSVLKKNKRGGNEEWAQESMESWLESLTGKGLNIKYYWIAWGLFISNHVTLNLFLLLVYLNLFKKVWVQKWKILVIYTLLKSLNMAHKAFPCSTDYVFFLSAANLQSQVPVSDS